MISFRITGLQGYLGNWTNCLKIQPCDVITMIKRSGEVGKKTPKKARKIFFYYRFFILEGVFTPPKLFGGVNTPS